MPLSDRRLIVTTGGRKTDTLIDDDAALLAAYRTHFGIVLDRPPHLSGGAGKPAQIPGKEE
jgi:hypothetical protein